MGCLWVRVEGGMPVGEGCCCSPRGALLCTEFSAFHSQISCGSTHSLLLTKSGGVYSWGTNAHGQLGQRGVIEVSCFRLIPTFSRRRAVTVVCGNEYSAALDDSGHLWAWGRADGGQVCAYLCVCMSVCVSSCM